MATKGNRAKLDSKRVLDFLLAGKATITLVSKRTGTRFTYKVNRPNSKSPHFVRLLTGPDNRSNYSYMGRIADGNQYVHDRKERAGKATSPSALGFRAVFRALLQGNHAWLNANVEIWHEGKCGQCGRKLTVPESIASGIGPVCAGKATPTVRKQNVIRKPKAIQEKAADCVVTEGHNDQTFNVKSPTGETYSVEVKNGNAYCGCEWAKFRPTADQRCGCSHGQAALDFVEQKTAGRKLSVWTEETDAKRQHRPARNVGDGTIVTSRLLTDANKTKEKARKVMEQRIAEKAEFATEEERMEMAAFTTKMERDDALEAQGKANQAKAEKEETLEQNDFVSRLRARAG